MFCCRAATLAALFILFPGLCGAVTAADKKPWKDQTVQIGDIKVHYIEAGSGDRHLVFVPGWTMIAEVWREQMVYFSARGFHVIAIDPRSHGLTTKTDGGNTYYQQAADLFVFLRTLDIPHPVLVGWSSGVSVLLEYLSSPEALQPEAVVLVDGAPVLLNRDDYTYGMTLQQARDTFLRMQDNREKFVDQFVRGMFKSRQAEILIKELVEGSLKTPIGAAVSLFFDSFSGDRRTALLRVEARTLIIMAQERRTLGEYLQSKISRSQLEVIPDAGHALFLEKPQTFNQVVESFIGGK